MSFYDIISYKKLVVSIQLGRPLERPIKTILVYPNFSVKISLSKNPQHKFCWMYKHSFAYCDDVTPTFCELSYRQKNTRNTI